MKVTFKDVGQGDSIILEWTEDGTEKVGIIDCNRKEKTNPVLDFIDQSKYQQIEFIILSHPHSDHYSGMVELLDLLAKKNIVLACFSHTLHLLGTDYHRYLSRVEIDTEALVNLQELFEKVHELKTKGIIKKIAFVSEGWQQDLAEGITMKCLSPSAGEAKIYMDQVDLEPFTNKKAASKNANYLSTIFKISIDDRYYLLTSDCEVSTFERLVNENTHKDLQKKQLEMCQLPHHGASKNYHSPFWDFVSKHANPHAVVSAGLNEKYKHPHLPVLMGFYQNGFNIHSTNIVYGMEEFVDFLKQIAITNNKLDTFSQLVSYHSGGDKTFPVTE